MPAATPVSYVLFDACLTLMHKPTLWQKMLGVLANNGYQVNPQELETKHKILSEAIHFPDQTSKDFYQQFNAEVLYALGILPTKELLKQIFEACTYLEWEAYDDTAVLTELNLPIGVLSNFNSTLKNKLDNLVGDIFDQVIISEVLGVAKPKVEFYEQAIELIGVAPEEILYVGDSIKLDMQPALAVGMQPYLIDRNQIFMNYPQRLDSLQDLQKYL